MPIESLINELFITDNFHVIAIADHFCDYFIPLLS